MNGGAEEPRRGGAVGTRLGIAILIVVATWMAHSLLADRALAEGAPAPPWTLPRAGPKGETLSLAELEGQVVVLDFWSTTCPPCMREMEDLKVLWRRMKPRGVIVVGISTGGDSPAQIASFGEKRHIDYPLVVDHGPVTTAYRVSSLPTLYVIDRAGRIFASHVGYWPLDELARSVSQALESPSE